MFTPPKLFCGFGDNQVKEVMQHCPSIFSVSDVYKYVDIWHPSIASEVLFAISTIFKDVDISHLDMEESDDIQESSFDFDGAIFDFEVEDSLMAAIPLELLSVYEDFAFSGDSDMDENGMGFTEVQKCALYSDHTVYVSLCTCIISGKNKDRW